jgi:hypothetical protein
MVEGGGDRSNKTCCTCKMCMLKSNLKERDNKDEI